MTWWIVGINVFWLVFIEIPHGLGVQGIVQTGALDWPNVAMGQWYRLVSAMFVHMSLTHIGVNMFSLISLSIMEPLLGSSAFTVTYFVSGLVGNLLMLWTGPVNAVSAGASGAIFGIFGAALAFSLRGILTKGTRNQLLVVLILNLIFDVMDPAIGLAAHLGGLFAGILLGWLFGLTTRGRRIQYVAILCAVVTVFGLVWALFAV
ncbi:rhomboid family intramembrane serine protease [Alicyclobacillaceae bacterium I2511]|nr:rhomboid family intramembrane serine protease [Alicyclobacillaceae bacterium I2511]